MKQFDFGPGAEKLTPQEKLNILRDNADQIKEKTYFKKFAPDQMDEFRENHTDTSIQIGDLEDKMKAVVDEFKNQLKPLKKEQRELLQNLKHKGTHVLEEAYMFKNPDTKRIEWYNAEGELIDDHPMKSEDMQRTIFTRDLPAASNE